MKNPRYKEVVGSSYATSKPVAKKSAGKVPEKTFIPKTGKGTKKKK